MNIYRESYLLDRRRKLNIIAAAFGHKHMKRVKLCNQKVSVGDKFYDSLDQINKIFAAAQCYHSIKINIPFIKQNISDKHSC